MYVNTVSVCIEFSSTISKLDGIQKKENVEKNNSIIASMVVFHFVSLSKSTGIVSVIFREIIQWQTDPDLGVQLHDMERMQYQID